MGCGGSKAKGRENYSTLNGLGEFEHTSPLIRQHNAEEAPNLGNFLVTPPREPATEPPAPAPAPVAMLQQKQKQAPDVKARRSSRKAVEPPMVDSPPVSPKKKSSRRKSKHKDKDKSPPPSYLSESKITQTSARSAKGREPSFTKSTPALAYTVAREAQNSSQNFLPNKEPSFSDIQRTEPKIFHDSFQDLANASASANRHPGLSSSHIPSFNHEEEDEVLFAPPSPVENQLSQQDLSKQLSSAPASPAPPSIALSEETPANVKQDPPVSLPAPLLLDDDDDNDPPLLSSSPPTEEDLHVSSPQQQQEQQKKSRKKKNKRKSSSRGSLMAHLERGSSAVTRDKPLPGSESGLPFDDLYRLKRVLGTGAFSTVREGYHKSSATHSYAVKCVDRKKLSEEDEAALLDEVKILEEMKHVHIIRLFDFFVETSTYYLVMERMSGGELFDRIVAKAYYNEKEARDVCKILLKAVSYCHQHHVAHRDLKPENLLLLSDDDDSAVKIADFGFAKHVYAKESLTTQCGTPGYVAPEILEGIPYDERADMWSVGVILYILLGGYPPFIENNQRDLFRKIRKGEYEFHQEYWGSVSDEARELIKALLTVDPVKRFDADQALKDPWICQDDITLESRDLKDNLKVLTKFNAKRKFKGAVNTVVAANRLQSLGKDFLKNLS